MQILKIFKTLILFSIIYFTIDIGRYIFYPNLSKLESSHLKYTSFMKYRINESKEKGENLNIQQEWVQLEKVSPYIVKGLLIAEDDKFWDHNGFDVDGIENALKKNLKNGKLSAGGSTISQQLIKNLLLEPSKNPSRKIKEAILTWRMEKTLPKNRILELYLNSAEWGNGVFGIQAASHYYFNKDAEYLTAKESSKLLAVLPNPLIYNVNGTQKYVLKRSKHIYKILKYRGIIDEYNNMMIERNKGLKFKENEIESNNENYLKDFKENNYLNNEEINGDKDKEVNSNEIINSEEVKDISVENSDNKNISDNISFHTNDQF
jgi:monofunctional biosynthetic peptidoglycan transglycosylase